MEEHNDIAQMLALLHELQGIDFVRQLKLITERREFTPLTDNPLIYTVGGEKDDDYFEANRDAIEVMIYKGKKALSVNRYSVQSPLFHKQFRKKSEK